jgi:4-amino-4-deoxy-L-arabinose transferase-like glycosyltransferase
MKWNAGGLLVVAAALFLSAGLGWRGLAEPDEGRCAAMAAAMVDSGDWLTPRLYDRAHFNKPPLLYWTMAASMTLFGKNEWAARITPAAAALLTLLLTYALARRLYNERVAIAATLVLVSSPLFAAMARIVDPNMLLTFLTTAALWAALAWFQDRRWRHLVAFYAAIALSFLAKGPVGLAIVGLTLLGYGLKRRDGWPWAGLWNTPLALLCASVSLGWYLAACLQNPELFSFFVRRELVERVFTDVHDRGEPMYFYALLLPAAVLPWLPFVVRGAAASLRTFRTDAPSRLLAMWILLPAILFTLASSKMPTYILPLLPPLAIWAGSAIAAHDAHRLPLGPCLPALLLAPALPVALHVYGQRAYGWEPAFGPADVLPALILLAALAAALLARPPRLRTAAAAVALMAAYLACDAAVAKNETRMGAHTTTRGIARVLAAHIRPGDRVVLYDRHPRGLDFYLDHPVSIPTFKFEIQLPSDLQRLAGYLYDDSQDVMDWFDSTQRVFVLTAAWGRGDLERRTKTRPVDVYRDSKYILVCNRTVE